MAGGKVLVLGGIRSGKSEFAEALLADEPQVRYVATAGHDDDSFAERIAAHQFRRPATWETVEATGDPSELIEAVSQAGPDAAVLVDDLGGWATALLGRNDAAALVSRLADAVRMTPAQVVLVSPEVGLTVVPPTAVGVEFADLMGDLNRAVAEACDEVSLIVAGQPQTLKKAAPKPKVTPPPPTIWSAPSAPAATPAVTVTEAELGMAATAASAAAGAAFAAGTTAGIGTTATGTAAASGAPTGAEVSAATAATAAETAAAAWPPAGPATAGSTGAAPATAALTESTRALPILETGMVIRPGMDLPIHDDDARSGAEKHLSRLDIPGSGLGDLGRIVVFAAGTQAQAVPQPWRQPHLVLLHGGRDGDGSAGDSVTVSTAIAQAPHESPIGLLAAQHGVRVKVAEVPTAEDMVYGRTASIETIQTMLTQGWQLADDAADSGADIIIIGSCSPGADAMAAAVVSRITGSEIAGLLGRIVGPDGNVDDPSWILRAGAVRDALHRSRDKDLNADTILSELAGPDVAVATGLILGATARRTPVLIDGPLGSAAALLARDLGSQSRLWITVADHGGHPVTKTVADILGAEPYLSLRTGLGEGTASLLALPLFNNAITLAGSLPLKPPVLSAPPEFEGSMPLVD